MPFHNPTTFANTPLDRASHLRADAGWLAEAHRDPAARVVALWQLKPLVLAGEASDRGAAWLTWTAIAALNLSDPPTIFLGLEGQTPCFAVDISALADPERSGPLAGLGKFMDLRSALSTLSADDAACLGQAKAMIDWHARHGFCAQCGSPTIVADAGYRRDCANCKTQHFPRTDPVVIMVVTRNERALLGRPARLNVPFYTALAGFIEPAETIEEAVAREVKEETAVVVSSVRYAMTQPWPFPSSLMIGCIAEATTEEIRIDPNELADARWFTRAELAEALERPVDFDRLLSGAVDPPDAPLRIPPRFAIAHHLIRAWVEGG